MSTPLLHQSKRRTGFSWWYHSLIDFILINPGSTHAEMAKAMNRGIGTIGMVVTSDLFKAELARRRANITKQIDQNIVETAGRVAAKALGRIEEKLDGDEHVKIGVSTLMDVADRTLNKLGYGTQPQSSGGNGQAPVNIQVNVDVLAQAREKARAVQAGHIIEGTVTKKGEGGNA